MSKIFDKISNGLANSALLRSFHGYMTVLWGLLIPVTVFTGLKGSIVWIALMSVWANFVGHFSSWQAARVEVKQDDKDSTKK
jgi:hypothetical protein